jgi:hypothetical protein
MNPNKRFRGNKVF